MCPQPFCEYCNIVPHGRTSGCTQFVEVWSVSTVPPRAERVQGYAEPLGYLFLVDEFREFHLRLFARLVGSGVLLVSSPDVAIPSRYREAHLRLAESQKCKRPQWAYSPCGLHGGSKLYDPINHDDFSVEIRRGH